MVSKLTKTHKSGKKRKAAVSKAALARIKENVLSLKGLRHSILSYFYHQQNYL